MLLHPVALLTHIIAEVTSYYNCFKITNFLLLWFLWWMHIIHWIVMFVIIFQVSDHAYQLFMSFGYFGNSFLKYLLSLFSMCHVKSLVFLESAAQFKYIR